MLLPIAFALGALLGWHRARRRGGDRLDRIQYAAAHGILVLLLTVIALVAAGRLGLV
jgi:hypothetical protein